MLGTVLGNGYSRTASSLSLMMVGVYMYRSSRKYACLKYFFFFQAGPVIMSLEEKMEADARSIYVGNVCIEEESG